MHGFLSLFSHLLSPARRQGLQFALTPLLFFQTKLSLSFRLSPLLSSFMEETKTQKGTLISLVKLMRNNLEQEAVSPPLSCRSLELTPPTPAPSKSH